MRLRRHLQRLLMLVGFGLLAFCAAAKLHELILSRAVMRRFEDLRQATANNGAEQNPVVQPRVVPPPDFLLWSEQRIKHYEESLSDKVTPPLAVIRIDRIHVEAPVLEGTDDLTLNRGIGHIAGTALFGQNGNVGLAGHRDGFFRGLKDIKVGDRIDLEEPGRVETYAVDRLRIVNPKDVSVLRSGGKPALTLVTCYPFYYIGSAPQRFIVHAVPADSNARAGVGDKCNRGELVGPVRKRREGKSGVTMWTLLVPAG
ncbi:MAG: class D sortase [Candidatus Sulfotelmatobacter sp.]